VTNGRSDGGGQKTGVEQSARDRAGLGRAADATRLLLQVIEPGIGRMKDDYVRYKFEIYFDGVVYEFRVRGTKRFLAERDFLDWLIGCPRRDGMPQRPVSGRKFEHYMLTREQLEMYAEYRKNAARTSD
jgi:hypothetical protein